MAAFVPTPEQTAILGHDADRHARVLAGPGTGKSATLVALVDPLRTDEYPDTVTAYMSAMAVNSYEASRYLNRRHGNMDRQDDGVHPRFRVCSW